MVALVRTPSLDLGDALPEAARLAIRQLLADDPRAARRVYAALARKIWTLLIERRFDPEIRDWHSLLNAVKAKVRSGDMAAAERITALADLLHESINFAEISPAREMAERPRSRAVLEALAKDKGFIRRRALLKTLGIGSSNLSNVLTHLAAHSLVERRENGKEAEFRLTRLGRELSGGSGDAANLLAPLPEMHWGDHISELFRAEQLQSPSDAYHLIKNTSKPDAAWLEIFEAKNDVFSAGTMVVKDSISGWHRRSDADKLLDPSHISGHVVFNEHFFTSSGTKHDRVPALTARR